MEQKQTLDISWETIIKVFIAGFVLYVLFLARDIVVWFFFALIISLLVQPVINFLRKIYVPKILAVILVYLSIFGILGVVIYLTAPILIFEINQLSQNIPEYFEKLNPIFKSLGISVAQNFEDFTSDLVVKLQESSGSIIKAMYVFFGGLASTILIFVFAFYISLEEKGPEKFLSLLTPKKYESRVVSLFENAQFKVAGWFGASILSLISGLLNFVPFIGPLITAVLAVLFVGVSNSWLMAIYILVALYAVQAIDNNIITPLLMKKFLDLPPILVLISLLVGGMIFGILGMIFVVPVFGIIYEFLKEFFESKKREEVHSNISEGQY